MTIVDNLQKNDDNLISNEIIHNQTIIGEEKSQAIAHKYEALKRLNESFNKHIELLEYKKNNILAYWIKDFSKYHDEERFFNPSTLKVFKRGDIIKVNLGFNIGNELGGLHYCVVINKNDNLNSGNLNVIPLSSFKENKKYNDSTCVDLGDELFKLLDYKFDSEFNQIMLRFSKITNIDNEENMKELKYISARIEYLNKIKDEIQRMKHGSIAYVHQITTISKQRIFRTPILSGIRISDESLDLLDNKIKSLFTKN